MKLSEYFKHQQSQEMPAHLRSELFSRIQKEKNGVEISTKIPSKIFFFASKRIMYASLVAVLVFVVFGGLLLDKTQIVDFGIFSVKQNNIPNGVFADYVAEVVEFNGEYSLVRAGKTVLNSDKLNIIQDGDVVSFPEGTDLIFNLEDGTQAKIVGPAEFTISKTEQGYQISLFDGKFFRIYCPECTSDVEIITPDFTISQEKDQTLDLHIAKEDNGEMLVKNDGDKVIVKTKNSENKTEVKQISSELVAINSSLDKINYLEDEDVMLNFMNKNNISATFVLSTENVDIPEIKKNIQDKVVAKQSQIDEKEKLIQDEYEKVITGGNIDNERNEGDKLDPLLEGIKEIISSNDTATGIIDEDIVSQLGLLTDNEQKLPTTTQMNILQTNLNGFFLLNIFESIYKHDKEDQNILKFADRINSISSVFGYTYHARADLSSIQEISNNLKADLEKHWYISPSYIIQLEKVSNWCDELKNPSKSDWESLLSNLPLNLRLM